MATPAVGLIGGAPGAGKTTLGRALGSRLEGISHTIDDLAVAAKAITTPETHPGLHVMTRAVTGMNSVDYFTASSVDKLIADATLQHEAT
ncbi:MAG TPA: hypothetical protein EYQ61_11720 [Dehalococcoidia bacterium]|jgi:adenylate kinase family enzyme|nr:hypothetical protein [Dehalococcoidia bacterium]HIK89171.1 hypothetical protein [Dehalococcoidia bacterium]